MTQVCISYRRSDSAGWTGRLYDGLRSKLGPDAIFYDIDRISAGEDFVTAVERHMATSEVALVVIGPTWLDAQTTGGRRRLDQPNDHVRKEIELALNRKVTIIPVLLGGAKIPTQQELPESIRGLSRRNALAVSDVNFNRDVDNLVRAMQRVVDIPGSAYADFRRRRTRLVVGCLGAFSLTLLVGALIAYRTSMPSNESTKPASSPSSATTSQAEMAEILGETAAIEVFCEGFGEGAIEMLTELHYIGAVVPECGPPTM